MGPYDFKRLFERCDLRSGLSREDGTRLLRGLGYILGFSHCLFVMLTLRLIHRVSHQLSAETLCLPTVH